ncbi:MAG: hypothetical protein EKK65_10495, partial [Lysobacterales bacterium]
MDAAARDAAEAMRRIAACEGGELDLSGLKHLEALPAELARLTGLQSLDLSECESLTDVSVLAGLTGLQSLDLSWCPSLTDVSVLAGLTGLQSLDLSWCPSLT